MIFRLLFFLPMKKLKSILLSALILIVLPTILKSQAKPISSILKIEGFVFSDNNENGIFDPNEKPIQGVLISNGTNVVKSDIRGQFTIDKHQEYLFPIIGEKYKISGSKTPILNSANLVRIDSLSNKCLIALSKRKTSKRGAIAMVGDMQAGDSLELDYANRSVISELRSSKEIDLAIFLGDIINDDVKMMKPVKDALLNIGRDVAIVAGNHDRDQFSDNKLKTFNSEIGTETFAFFRKKTLYVIINNVVSEGKHGYFGGYSDSQLNFVKELIETAPSNTNIVICQHIPFIHTKNRDLLAEILYKYKPTPLFYSGHTHTVSNHSVKYKTTSFREIGSGASCGNWWQGEKGADGVPEAMMQCGSPRNYFLTTRKGETLISRYKAIGKPKNFQGTVTISGSKVLANIFGASDSSQVRIKINGGKWLQMKKEEIIATEVANIIENNKNATFPTHGNTKNPLRKRASSHIWTIESPSGNKYTQALISVKESSKNKILFKSTF